MDEKKRHSRKKKAGQPKGRRASAAALAQIASLLGDKALRRDLLIEYLHKIQDSQNCIRDEHIVALADLCKISPSEVYEAATFYHHFDVVKDGGDAPAPITVRVCDSITCEMYAAEQLIADLKQKMDPKDVRVQRVPCVGRCDRAPLAIVRQNPIPYANSAKVMTALRAEEFSCAVPNYLKYEDYCRQGGFALWKSLCRGDINKEQVFRCMEASGLRGLGGAGFPVGRKWRIVSGYASPRLMAINIDEGEPGTFKDLYYLEKDPFRFLDGVLIAAWVVGIAKIYVYLRDEYAGVRTMLEQEIPALLENLGLSEDFIELRRGAGSYICGEESAMIESIEGKRGVPRLRPPFIAEVGLFGRPTLEHNMESLYWVRDIAEKGADWFSSHGRHGRKGLRSFSVSGRVKKPGVHLAPAGITMQELLEEYCQGMMEGYDFYGYFPGGASGGILPAKMADIPLDFETLQEHGCFIGSAAVIVLSKQDGAAGAARNAMRFFREESCGKCTPCRVGTAKACGLMDQKKWDAPLLTELFQVMSDASICGLGQAAPNPALCVMKHFTHETQIQK